MLRPAALALVLVPLGCHPKATLWTGTPIQVATNGTATCVLIDDGDVWCWGDPVNVVLGDSTAPGDDCRYPFVRSHQGGVNVCDAPLPLRVDTGRPFVQIALAPSTGKPCGLTANGQVFCWPFASQEIRLLSGDTVFASISGSGSGWCGLTDVGEARCWSISIGDAPPVVVPGGLAWKTFDAGYQTYAGVDVSGTLFTGGFVDDGTDVAGPPGAVTPPPLASAVAGQDQGCGVDDAGTAWCWGTNVFGEVGDGSPPDTTGDFVPPARVSLPLPVIGLDAGMAHNCAVTSDGNVWCWGWDGGGELGGTSTSECTDPVLGDVWPCALAPVEVGLPEPVDSVSAGNATSCALAHGGHVYCWGANEDYQVGSGGTALGIGVEAE